MTNDNDKKRAFPMPKAEQNFTRWTNNNVTRLPADMAGALALIDSLVIQRDAAEALARQACARESELGLQVVAQAARLRLADGLRDFCESPPIQWVVSDDRQTMTARCDDATATIYLDGRLTLLLDDGRMLARVDVSRHDGAAPGVRMEHDECQMGIGAALLWSHRRGNRLDKVAAWDAVPGDVSQVKGTPFDEAGTMNPDKQPATSGPLPRWVGPDGEPE